RLGFDIATGIFGNPALGASGNTATGPGSLAIRDALSAAGQRGFNASVKFLLSRSYLPTSRVVPSEEIGPRDGVLDGDAATSRRRRSDSPVVTKNDQFGSGGATGRARAALQPENTIKVSVRYKKEFGYLGDTNAFGYVGPTSCSAFSVSVAIGNGADTVRYPIRISSESKMEEASGYYFCNYLVSDIPLDYPVTVSVSLTRIDPTAEWMGGTQKQPPPGQRRTIILVSGRESGPLILTATQPRARQLFEMIYASPPQIR
ncbi:MAG TPA: hypothetical protein VLE19_00675, partial [Pyrinomonadaceae bacterium]|nr:hypothetical protein [Pyrinomonadaceae bacterium]